MTTEAYPGTRAVRRAVSLLKAFAGSPPELSLGELCRASGLNKPTAYRLLTALESEGMVERTPEAGYRLGPEVLALGNRRHPVADLRPLAAPVLGALAQEARETATLEVLAGRDVLILEETMGGYVVGSLPSVGTRWAAHATSTGKVLLAHLPAGDPRLRGPFARFTARTITSPAALGRELARARRRGWAVSVEELEPGFVAVGAPVRRAGGDVIAALSVGGPRTRITPDRVGAIAERVVAAAARLSESLGYRGPDAKASAGPGRMART